MNTDRVDGTTKAGIILTYVFGGLSIFIIFVSWYVVILLPLPIIAMVYAYKLQMGEEKARTVAGVLALLGAGIVPGILILVGRPLTVTGQGQQINPQWNNNQPQWNNNQQPQPVHPPKQFDKVAEIEKLDNLLKAGSITHEEFEKLKADVLKK